MRFPFVSAATGAAFLVLAGCAPKQEPKVAAEAPPAGGNPLAQESTTPPSPTPPGVTDDTSAVTEHGGRETPEGTPGSVVVPPGFSPGAGGLTPTPALDAKITKLEKDGSAKKTELAAAYAERGVTRMNDGPAAPRIKYPAALKDLRRALELDPKNVDARQSADMIESIYKRMGRPVPTN